MQTAVIMGGGFAGLLAAEALADFAVKVIVVDRDGMGVASPRRGVGQANHLHVLLRRGRDALEEFFPAFDESLARLGAAEIDWGGDTAWYSRRGWFPREVSGVRTRSTSRGLLETEIRRRVFTRTNLDLREKTEVRAVRRDSEGKILNLVTSRGDIAGDFFVDARGRPGRRDAESVGPARSTGADGKVGYASLVMDLPAMKDADFRQLYIQLRPDIRLLPDQGARGGVLVPLEDGSYRVTLIQAGAVELPADLRAVQAFARTLAHPAFAEALDSGRALGDVSIYRRTASRRPSGISAAKNSLAIGDAACAFNPVYGQGMTVAALAALSLRANLRRSENPERVVELQAARMRKILRAPWLLSASEDLRLPEVELLGVGRAHRVGLRLVGCAVDRLMDRATTCADTHRRLLRVLHMLDGPLGFFHGRVAPIRKGGQE